MKQIIYYNFDSLEYDDMSAKDLFSELKVRLSGNTFSASSIAKYLKSEHRSIDNETIYNYLCKLESAYILHRCSDMISRDRNY